MQNMKNKKTVSVVIPTYNEAKNVPSLLLRIHNTLKSMDYEVIIVDDSSPDGTSKVVLNQLMYFHYPVRLVTRINKQGLALAVVEGFKESTGDIICVIDADLQHPPELLKELIDHVNHGYDIAIASRYVVGGSSSGFGITRHITSIGAKYLAYILLPKVKQVKDPLSGYFAIRRSVLDNVELTPVGYKILLELLVKGNYNLVKEIPFTFQERKYGKSNLNVKEHISYIHHLIKLLNSNNSSKAVKFAIVGASGVLVNEGLLYIFVDWLHLNMFVSSLIAIQTAIVTNFMFNTLWTFKDIKLDSLFKGFLKFESVCILGATVNFILLVVLTTTLGIYYLISNLIAIMIAFIVNYFGSKEIVWTSKVNNK